jgi:hypothetical protein
MRHPTEQGARSAANVPLITEIGRSIDAERLREADNRRLCKEARSEQLPDSRVRRPLFSWWSRLILRRAKLEQR